MGSYDFPDLIDLSWAKDLTTIPDLFIHDPCLSQGKLERKLFYARETEALPRETEALLFVNVESDPLLTAREGASTAFLKP